MKGGRGFSGAFFVSSETILQAAARMEGRMRSTSSLLPGECLSPSALRPAIL